MPPGHPFPLVASTESLIAAAQDWYVPYLDARQRGQAPDEAVAAANRYMAEVKHVATR